MLLPAHQESRTTNHGSRITDHGSRITDHASRITNHDGFPCKPLADRFIMSRHLSGRRGTGSQGYWVSFKSRARSRDLHSSKRRFLYER